MPVEITSIFGFYEREDAVGTTLPVPLNDDLPGIARSGYAITRRIR